MSLLKANNSSSTSDKKDSILKKILDFVLPAGVSAVLIIWLFHRVHIKEIIAVMRAGCDYGWLIIMCVVLVMSRSIRGIRWGLQLRAAGIPRMPVFSEMVSIYGAYALNLMLTGVGEVWRCLYVARRQKASLTTVVGTDLGDRISDAIMIIGLVVLSLIVARPTIVGFMDHYSFGRKLYEIVSSFWFWGALILLTGGILWLLFSKSQSAWIIKMKRGALNLWIGFKVLFTMKHRIEFWSETLLIWICYFLMTYLCFFAFPFTRELVRPDLAYGFLPGLVVFIFGSLSIAIPATGGLGPWNIAVMFALSLYGVDQAEAATYSMVVWAFQTVTQILMGLVGAGYITFERRHSH